MAREITMWHSRTRRTLLGSMVGAAVFLGVAVEAAAQEPDEVGWRLRRWSVGVVTTFDQNPFLLSDKQRERLLAGADRYASLSQPHELTTTVLLGATLRGRGLVGRRLELESDVGIDVYAFNRRRAAVEVELSATQQLSKRDEVRLGLGLTPSEFRRNYLAPSAGGGAEYVRGMASTAGAELAYRRRVLRGSGGSPDLTTEAAVFADRRAFRDLPWRDRTQLGAGLEAELDMGTVGIGLSAQAARAFDSYDGAEPVQTDAGVVMTSLERGFDELRLGAETSIRTGRRTRVVAQYGFRQRGYAASLTEDPYYGGREDRRHALGGGLRLNFRRLSWELGAEHQIQTTYRPGRGDTGDETDYRRSRAFLGLIYTR